MTLGTSPPPTTAPPSPLPRRLDALPCSSGGVFSSVAFRPGPIPFTPTRVSLVGRR